MFRVSADAFDRIAPANVAGSSRKWESKAAVVKPPEHFCPGWRNGSLFSVYAFLVAGQQFHLIQANAFGILLEVARSEDAFG